MSNESSSNDLCLSKNSVFIVFLFLLTLTLNAQQKPEIKGMVFIEGATFDMGSKEANDEQPIHKVTLKSYYISKYEVTCDEYYAFCKATKKKFPNPPDPDWTWSSKEPITFISWDDANEYCKWAGVRLPTEAEWEYAAKGGSKGKGTSYSGGYDLEKFAWYKETSDETVNEIGKKLPNELGIFDMSGNVREWCSDWYDSNYYKNSPKDNPKGPETGKTKILRGGGFLDDWDRCMVTNRGNAASGSKDKQSGFRVVKDVN